MGDCSANRSSAQPTSASDASIRLSSRGGQIQNDGGSMVEIEVGNLVDARSRTKASSMHVTASWAGQVSSCPAGLSPYPPLALAMSGLSSSAVVNYINSSLIGPDSNYPYSHSA
jgi:hypothetical protein